MKNSHLFRIMEVIMLIILGCSSMSCAAWGESRPERPDKAYEEYGKVSIWYEKYLYFEMPVDEFVSLFTKDILTDDPDKPHIINHKNNSYIVKDSKGTKYRITFENGLLTKFEKFGWEKIPIITAAYYERTYLLRGSEVLEERAKTNRGFYSFMPEKEFLRTFSNSILSHSRNRDGENYYVIIGKDGRKHRITFSSEGFLIGME